MQEISKNIIERIRNAGYPAFFAGACVRELLMGEEPAVYMIITEAPREAVRAIFKKTLLPGDRKNYVIVYENKTVYEVYCPKEAGEKSLSGLLSSFDFTINAIAYDPSSGVWDPLGGREDLEKKIIRPAQGAFMKNPDKPERMIRAVRYSAQLGFSLSRGAEAEIRKFSSITKKTPGDKIREEIDKIIMSKRPEKVGELHRLGILRHIMPELDICFSVEQKNKYHIYNVGEHIVHAVEAAPADPVIRWAALLHDIGKPEVKSVDANGVIHFYGHHRVSVRIAGEILRRIRMEAQMTRDILCLIENHDVRIEASLINVKQMMGRTGAELFLKLIDLQEADNKAKNMKFFRDKQNKLNDVRRIFNKVIAERQPYRISDLAVGARDMGKLGYRPGHEVSEVLIKLLEDVLVDPGMNTREYLMARARELKKQK